MHCDDVMDDETQPEALRNYLRYNRLPAVCQQEGISPGDVVAFSPYAVHRTSIIDGSDEVRESLDVRCFWNGRWFFK